MNYLPTTRMDVYLEYKSNILRALFLQIPARLNSLARGYSARHRARMGDQGTSGMAARLQRLMRGVRGISHVHPQQP